MDTLSLRLFVLAAEKLNISAAGRELGFAPAASSGRLAKLEHEFGADLLHRSTRKVSLSVEGEEFLPYAREIIAQEDAAKAALGHGSAAPKGTLRFAASSTFSQLYIAPIIPKFLEKYPDVDLDLRLSDSRFDLIEGSFDLALRNTPLDDISFKGRKLADETRVLCASPDYLKRHGTPMSPQELVQHYLIGFRESSARKLIGPNGEEAQFDPRRAKCRLVVDDGLSQKIATVAGAGITYNSLWSIHQELRDGSLVRVLPDYQIEDRSVLWLIYPKTNVLSIKVRVFIDFLIEEIGRAPAWLANEPAHPAPPEPAG